MVYETGGPQFIESGQLRPAQDAGGRTGATCRSASERFSLRPAALPHRARRILVTYSCKCDVGCKKLLDTPNLPPVCLFQVTQRGKLHFKTRRSRRARSKLPPLPPNCQSQPAMILKLCAGPAGPRAKIFVLFATPPRTTTTGASRPQ